MKPLYSSSARAAHGLDSGAEADWRTRGKCLGLDPDAMFPPDHHPREVAAAQAVCRGCPVSDECLAEALRMNDRFGIRAGFTPGERDRMKERGIRLCVRCGAGYVPRMPHQKRCRPCAQIVDPRKAPKPPVARRDSLAVRPVCGKSVGLNGSGVQWHYAPGQKRSEGARVCPGTGSQP